MAISAKIVNNFTKMNNTSFKDNYILVEVSLSDGSTQTRYARIGDLTLIQNNGIEQRFDNNAASRDVRKAFENAVDAFKKGEAQLRLDIGEKTENVTAVPEPITYRGHFKKVPSHTIKDETGLISAGGSKPTLIAKQRGYNVVKNDYLELNSDFKYIAVKLIGETDVKFVELPQIKFINDEGNLVEVGGRDLRGFTFALGQLNTQILPGTPKEYPIFLDNNGQLLPIQEIYTDATYKLEPATMSEFVDGSTVDVYAVGGINLESYKVRTLSVETTATGSGIEDRIVAKDKPIDKFYVEQKTDAKDLKPNQRAYVNYECYQLDETGSGDYLKIRYKGDAADTMVALEYLFLSKTDKESLKDKLANKDKNFNMVDLIGKPLFVKPKDESLGLIETEPLTNEEALFGYNERKFLFETTKDEDIASEGNGETAKEGEMSTGAYLLLKDGNFVKEADVVQPKCYDFCRNQSTTVFDAYLVTVDDNAGNKKTFVVDKSYKGFNTASSITEITLPGVGRITVNKNTLRKLERSKNGINGCDVIQTSSKQGNDVENCVVLRNKNNFNLGLTLPEMEKLDEIIKQLYDEFIQNYKNKQYDIGNQLLIPQKQDDGTFKNDFVEFVQNRRYMYSSIVPMLDGATNTLQEYLNMKANEFTANADGSISGGPKYDAKKGVREGYSKLGTAAAYALGFTFSGGGLLVALASPFLLLVPPAVLGAAGLVIPIVEGVKKNKVEQRKYEFSNKSEAQNKSIKQDAFEKINELVEQVKAKYKQGKEKVAEKRNFCLDMKDEQLFLTQLGVIEQELVFGLTQNKNGGTFRVDGGKGGVNRANAHEFNQYKEIVNNLAKDKKELENREKQLTKQLNQLKTSGGSADEIADVEKQLNNVRVAKETKQTEIEKANSNLIISGTNNATDPELTEILNRIENAKKFMLAKYFRKMDGEWIKRKENENGIIDLAKLLDRPDITKEEKEEIHNALVSYVMHTDISVDVAGRKFDYVNSHEKYNEEENVNWRKLKEIAKKYGLFKDDKIGMETFDVDPGFLPVEKPIKTKKSEKDAKAEKDDELKPDEEIENETGEETNGDAAEKKKPKKVPTEKGLSTLITKFNAADFTQYFKLIELNNKSKRKGLVYNEDAKRKILKYIKQYENYKELLYEIIAGLEAKSSLNVKETIKLEKLREFRDNSEYLIKSFNNSYGSFSEAEEEKSL